MEEAAGEHEEEEAMELDSEMQAEIEDDEELEEEHDRKPGPIVTGMVNDETQEVMMGLSSKSEEVLSAAMMRMRKILQSEMGGKMLHGYVLASPKCVELLNAWNAGPKARTAVSLLLLLADIFRHPMGLRGMSDDDDKSMVLAVQLKLDKFASSIVQSKLGDVYSHLSSGQRTRENSALRLMSSIVSRGKLLAKQVASKFDFSLDALKKLGKHPLKKREAPAKGDVSKLPTRVAFVEFAMSFLVAGDTGLLRWVLQKRVLYAGLLHGLANDNIETVIRVLGVFKLKVLLSGSVPQGIQVALFGDAALEQLAKITAQETTSEEVANLAQEVLLILCTDPAHGICPSGSSLEDIRKTSGQYGGGAGRLLRLMLKLKAAEVNLHRELLLAICKARPLLAAAYIDTFPYSLEPRVSSIWFSAMSLVSCLVRIANSSNSFHLQSLPPPTDSPLVQSSLRCIWPQTLARAVFNKALLHDNRLIKLSCLRLLLEVLAALDRLLQSIQVAREACDVQYRDEWQKLECFVQDKARLVLPDSHTLLSVYFSSKTKTGSEGVGSKRKGVGDDRTDGSKKLKLREDGVVYIPADTEEVRRKLIHIWEEDLLSTSDEDVESITYSKLLDVFTEYQKVLPLALRDINFDPLKFIPEDMQTLKNSQQQSLVRLLLSTATMRKRSWDSGPLYKNLKLFIKLVVSLKTVDVRQQACLLLDEALHSTGAFESNPYEAAIWLHNLPGWQNGYLEFFDETVAAFFCDVVLSAGKNLYKYVDQLDSLLSTNSLQWTGLGGGAGDCEFGPMLVCVLDTYKRLARPDAKSLKIPERAAISVYISKALQCLLSSQVYPQTVAGVITSMLSDSEMGACEWYPLRNLNSYASSILNSASSLQLNFKEDGSLNGLLEACQQDELGPRDVKSAALAKALLCVPPTELAEGFFNLLKVQDKVLEDYSVTATLLGAYPQLLYEVGLKFPAVFSEGKILNGKQQEQDGGFHNLSTLLASFLRSCPFSALFLAASYGDGRLLTLLKITESLSEVMSQVSGSDIVISARLVLQKIDTLHASRLREVDTKAQIEACFYILKDFILSPRSFHERQQLVEDFLHHPVLTEYFLSESRARGGSSPAFGECQGDISALVESLDPLNRHLLQILASLLPDTGNSACDYCEPLIQRATETFHKDVEQSYARDKEVVCSAPILAISILSPYAKMDLFIDFVQAFLKQAVERSKCKRSAQAMRSYRLVVIHLAFLCFQKLERDPSKRSDYEDKLMDIYSSVIHFTMVSPSDMSDSCMLTAMQTLKIAAPGYTAITPVEVLFYYMQHVNSVKRELVLHLIQGSPFMLVEFGCRIAGSEKPANFSSLMLRDTLYEVGSGEIGVEELMQLLPAVQYFLAKGRSLEWCQRKTLTEVSSFYGDLLVKQLLEWEAKADLWAGDVKQGVEGKECYEQSFLCSIVTVLQLSAGFRPLSKKQKRQLLRFLLANDSKVLDTSAEKVEAGAFPKMNNRIVAKASLLKWLILEQAEVESTELIKFITASVSTITAIYKQVVREDQRPLKGTDLFFVERMLLVFICDVLDKLIVTEPSCAYSLVRKMAKTLLRFRFAQAEAMGALHRVILKVLQNVKPEDTLTVQKLAVDVMDFVMAHSQFVQVLLTKEAAASATKGTVFRGIPSLLSVIGSPSDWQNQEKCLVQPEKEIQRLGLLKLLRVLYTFKLRNKDHDVSMGDNKMTSKELLSLLLAAYGATLSAADQEIFSLMNEIECGDGFKGMSEMDYLWGDAALARRKETAEVKRRSDEELFQENLEEIRKRRFKEDLALDARKCAITVLHFPMRRDLWASSSAEYENAVDVQQAGAEKYDPAFILPFAMHALSAGCIDPEEFVRSGLLAICFSSMSSACEGLRKCGYELLSIFTSILEGSPSFKCKSQIDSLLLFVKNAVTEPWQRMPFVVSLFSAEASCILMHPENSLYVTVNRFLLRFPSIDLKSIPLFQSLITSGSQESRIERSWIFKLLLAGLSTSADALIYCREFVPEIIMSFSTSSMADRLALRWVLQVLRRAVVFPTFAKSLVKDTGVLSWLTSVIVNHAEVVQDWEDARLAIEVMETLLSMRVVEAFFVTEGSEELSRTAIVLLELLCTATTTSKQWEHFSKPFFQILKTALRLAQKRKFHSSTLRLAWRPVRQLVHTLKNRKEADLNAIECLLHSSPPPLSQIQDDECLCALTTLILSGRGASQLDRTSTAFLRWCSASLILAEQPLGEGLEFTTWWSFFTYLNSKTRDYYFSMDLPRCLVALSNMNAIEAATDVGVIAAVNALLVLLTRTSQGSSLVSGAVHELLKILLYEVPCPQELDPHWRWGFYKARSHRNLNLYEREIYKLLLALLQRLYTAPWGNTSELIHNWRSTLQTATSDDISEDAEASSRLDELRKRLYLALQ